MPKHTNHLVNETSPYLLQHAHNPVDWYPWGDEALNRARKEDKPILVSIGYAACHWCHVMERESFENEEVARLMNENFINIKIDREERPDIDHIYMDAVQAMTGSGGWPLNAFLTPDGKPFYGGTYFPPVRAFNRASWSEVLQGVAIAFKDRRDEINSQAQNLTDHLIQSNSFGVSTRWAAAEVFTKEKISDAVQNILKTADREWGGFGNAPKFPQTFTIQFLLRTSPKPASPKPPPEEGALGPSKLIEASPEVGVFEAPSSGGGWGEVGSEQALLSLDKMIEGGIYDQVGGGFARYSTDTEWLAPHFEKMLYDNALLVSILSEAYQLTRKQRYKEVIDETIGFVKRELFHPENGFYAALDADSEGEEGKFYVWQLDEVKSILGEDAEVFCQYYDITERGNWSEGTPGEETKNILRIKQPLHQFARQNGIDEERLRNILEKGKAKLLAERNKRVRPLLDDKLILGWNALMNTACSKAFMATGNEEYRQMAIANMEFLLTRFGKEANDLHHTWKNGVAKYPAFLDDYAFLIQALICLQEITGNTEWLKKARGLTQHVIDHFSENDTGFFYFTRTEQEDVIVRKKEIYDGAVPSGNSVMGYNLYYLSLVFDRQDWKERAMNMVVSLGEMITRYPTSFGVWACLLQEMVEGTYEIAMVGQGKEELLRELYAKYLPHKVLMSSDTENQEFPLLRNKPQHETPLIYLCKNYVCQQPVASISRFMLLINSTKIVN